MIDKEREIKEKVNANDLKIIKGQINFKDVSFKYIKENNQILNSINLEIPRKMTALWVIVEQENQL